MRPWRISLLAKEALKELKRADEARDNTFDSWIVDLEEEENSDTVVLKKNLGPAGKSTAEKNIGNAGESLVSVVSEAWFL